MDVVAVVVPVGRPVYTDGIAFILLVLVVVIVAANDEVASFTILSGCGGRTGFGSFGLHRAGQAGQGTGWSDRE